MDTNMQQATAHNRQVLSFLTYLLNALQASGAFIGRDESYVAIDLHRTPTVIQDDPLIISDASRLFAGGIGEFGVKCVFSAIRKLPDYLLFDMRGLLGDADTFRFPLLAEVRALFADLPVMSPEDSMKIKSIGDEASVLSNRFLGREDRLSHESCSQEVELFGTQNSPARIH
jgi:hypothetical protein